MHISNSNTSIWVDIHTHNLQDHEDSWVLLQNDGKKLVNSTPFSVSIHPWDTEDASNEWWSSVKKVAENPLCKAIGETGLDKLHQYGDAQKELFIKHIQLANLLNKPLVIHAVKTHQECVEILKNQKNQQRVLFHGFRKSKHLAKDLLEKGFYLSFGSFFDKMATDLIEFLKERNFKNCFLETDNQKNESIKGLYDRASQSLNIPLSELQKIIIENKKTFLGK